jgi:excisionase family DNA binding protein
MKAKPFPYLTITDVARAADLARVTIYKHINEGNLAAIRVQGFREYMIEPAALTAFLQARARGEYVRPPKRQPLKPKSSCDVDNSIVLSVKEVA